MGSASKLLRDSEASPALRLEPGERLRATVLDLPSPGMAVLGIVGHRLAVKLHRHVAVGDELLVEVVYREAGGEQRPVFELRCLEAATGDVTNAGVVIGDGEQARSGSLDTRA